MFIPPVVLYIPVPFTLISGHGSSDNIFHLTDNGRLGPGLPSVGIVDISALTPYLTTHHKQGQQKLLGLEGRKVASCGLKLKIYKRISNPSSPVCPRPLAFSREEPTLLPSTPPPPPSSGSSGSTFYLTQRPQERVRGNNGSCLCPKHSSPYSLTRENETQTVVTSINNKYHKNGSHTNPR